MYSVTAQFDVDDAPIGVADPSTPNPTLRKNLSNGVDTNVADARDRAVEKLTDGDDILGFWMQALGDGTSLTNASDDRIEQLTPLQVAYMSGVDGSLEFTKAVDIAAHLFTHHFGSHADPSRGHAEKSSAQLYEEEIRALVGAVEDRYGTAGSGIENSADSPSFDERRTQAAAILESNRLSYFWVQFVVDDTSKIVFTIGNWLDSVDLAPGSIEWIRGVDERIDGSIGPYVTPTLLVQHLHVSAQLSHHSPNEVGQRALRIGPGAYP